MIWFISALIFLIVGIVCFMCGWFARMAYMERQFQYNPWYIKKICERKIAKLESQQSLATELPISPYTGQDYDPEWGIKKKP